MAQLHTSARVLTLCMTLCVAACTGNYEKKIQKGLLLYRTGDTARATELFEDAILGESCVAAFDGPPAGLSGAALYRVTKDGVRILYPYSRKLTLGNRCEGIACDIDSGSTAVIAGSDITIFSARGSVEKTLPVARSKRGGAAALLWVGRILLCCCDGKLYTAETGDAAPQRFGGEIDAPSSGGLQYASLAGNKDTAVLAAGIGGQYTLCIIDPAQRAIRARNIPAASQRTLIDGGALYYISGSSGSWTLCKIGLDGGGKKEIMSFTDMRDVAIFPGGIAHEGKNGMRCADIRTGNRFSIPFGCALIGQAGRHALLMRGETTHVTDMEAFMRILLKIHGEIPAFFDGGTPSSAQKPAR